MNLFHFRYRDRLGLLASRSLDAAETDELVRHVGACASCRAELAELTHVSSLLRDDATVERPLPISSDALRTRVFAHIRSATPHTAAGRRVGFAPSLASIGLVAAGILSVVLATRSFSPVPGPSDSSANLPLIEEHAEISPGTVAFYERLEKTQARANAVRYLSEAQDVLIQVTSAADCPDSPKDSVDVTREAQTSRQLLRRRAALISGSEETLVAARGVLEEVEGVLQQVAELEQCTRRRDVDAIARRMDKKNLLMKIDLMTQELAAP